MSDKFSTPVPQGFPPTETDYLHDVLVTLEEIRDILIGFRDAQS